MASDTDIELAQFIAQFYDDPLGFVIAAYPWDTDESIQLVKLPEPWASKYPHCKYGPDRWACELLDEIGRQVRERKFNGHDAVKPIRIAVSSGHGIGKSFLTACIIDWIMSTRPYAKGTVTATTNGQLATRTWAQIKSWTAKCLTADWFQLKAGRGSMTFESKEAPSDWFASAQSCRKENSEAFAGQHAANSTSFYIFDEGSGIDAKIYEVAEGGLTDGEPMIFVFGNPTRNSGPFYDIFHKQRDLWTTFKVDSREAQITNKASIAEWERLYGEDSDFFRVRVRGEFPNASSCQLISQDIVEQAMARKPDEFHPGMRPIALVGVDLAAMGDDKTAICTRVGNEVFDIKVLTKTDIEHVCAVLKDHIDWLYKNFGFERVYVFMDRGGIGQGHVERMQYAGYNVHGINFAQTPDKPEEYKNKRSEMWGRMRDWLRDEDAVLPDDDDLKYDLTAPEYFYDNGNRLQLESKEDMKKRGISSPDKGDALALTFAQKVFQPSDSVLLHQNRAAELTKRSRLIRR